MQTTIAVAIGIVVIVAVVLLNVNKKRKEQLMGEQIDRLIEAEDWQGVQRILRKQLILWGIILLLSVLYIILQLCFGVKSHFVSLVVLALAGWRFYKLARNYLIARDNERFLQEQDEQQEQES